MSETLTALATENSNPALSNLLQDVQRGNINVPRFQRPFLWKDGQRLQLLESIRDNMPIGSLLVWRTTKFELASFPTVGPHIIPTTTSSTSMGRQYLLDGHQRVSTLLGVLLAPLPAHLKPKNEDEDDIDWNIQYDLMDQDFVFVKEYKRSNEKRPLLPLWTLFDGRMVNKHMRAMREQAQQQNWSEQDLENWEERADQLSYSFQQYRIPIVVMVTDNLDLAARTFQRINSQGTPMGEAHLVAALTWTVTFDLREKLETLKENFPLGWREIEDRLFLQVCKGLISSDISKVDENQLVRALKENNELMNSAADGIKSAIDLFSRLGGVVRRDLLPYAQQLVYLAIEYANRKGQDIPEHAFMTWFWRTGWGEVFGSASFRKLRNEQSVLSRLSVDNIGVTWQGEWINAKHFDSRFARVRVWMLRMAAHQGLDIENEQEANGRTLLELYGKDAFVRLFPTPSGASPKLKALLQTLGNRFLVEPAKAYKLRKMFLDNATVSNEVLSTHFIEIKALTALRNGDLETFIEMRNAKIARWDLNEWTQEKQIFGATSVQGSLLL
jgi:hypothetical protein